jgi:hypothetical protein
MNRFARAGSACIAAIAGALTLVLTAPPAGAASACAERVIQDWSDNGRVDGIYPLSCYEEAVDAIPADLRDYTNAAEVIGRALTAAVRANGGGSSSGPAPPGDADAPGANASAVPLLPLGGAVFALGLVLAGGAAYAARRRRST